MLLKPPASPTAAPKPGRFLERLRQLPAASRSRRTGSPSPSPSRSSPWRSSASAASTRQFFPPSDRFELIVDFQLPRSSSIFASRGRRWSRSRTGSRQSEDVDFWTSYIGRNVIRFYLPLAILPPSDHHSQIVVMAKDLDARLRLEEALDAFLVETFPEAVRPRQPARDGAADRLAAPVPRSAARTSRCCGRRRCGSPRSSPPIPARSACTSTGSSRRGSSRIDVDQDQARRLGLTQRAACQTCCSTAVSGATVTQLRDDIYLVNVVARADAEDRVSLDGLGDAAGAGPGRPDGGAQLRSPPSASRQEQPLIWRRDRVPTLTVLADVAPGLLPETVVAAHRGRHRGARTTTCRPATRSRSAGRPRPRPRARPRSSRWCR